MWTRPARPTQCAGECRICAGWKSSLRPSVTWFDLTGPCHVVFRLLAAWQRWPRRGGSRNYVPQTGRPQVLGSNCWGLYLSENHLLSSSQHGFRPRHSTETALTSISDHILTTSDNGEVSLLCLLDLTKCFDVIDHSKLLSKLSLHGIDTSWFSAYLRDHTQSVSLTDARGKEQTSLPLPNSDRCISRFIFRPSPLQYFC